MDELKLLQSEYIKHQTQDIPNDLEDLVEELSRFQRYTDIENLDIHWRAENNIFMAQIGLPSSAPSMIEFRDFAISEIDCNFINIGFNNYGDHIVIIKNSGEIAYINHDSNNKVEYMNSDAISLFKCICTFSAMIKGAQDYPTAILEIDPYAFEDGRWWKQEYLNWINK